MTPMPKLPRTRKTRSTHACICGCGQSTKSTWFPGHDGRATGWAIRIERGMAINAVPSNERAGALHMLRKRGTLDMVVGRGNPNRQAA